MPEYREIEVCPRCADPYVQITGMGDGPSGECAVELRCPNCDKEWREEIEAEFVHDYCERYEKYREQLEEALDSKHIEFCPGCGQTFVQIKAIHHPRSTIGELECWCPNCGRTTKQLHRAMDIRRYFARYELLLEELKELAATREMLRFISVFEPALQADAIQPEDFT